MNREDELVALLWMAYGLYLGNIRLLHMTKRPKWLMPLLRRKLSHEQLNAVLHAVLTRIVALDREKQEDRTPCDLLRAQVLDVICTGSQGLGGPKIVPTARRR